MIKQQSYQTQPPPETFANNPTVDPIKQKIPPIQIQTYLPNLYLKKFRLIERLSNMRFGFPSVQNIQTNANQQYMKKLGPWDLVLRDVEKKVHFMNEKRKYKIAICAFISKKCQRKIKRRELKKEQIYYFHRIICSHISEKVIKKFQDVQKKQVEKNNKIKQEKVQEMKIQDRMQKVQNDVFIESGQNQQLFNKNNQNNLFDEFFQQNNNQNVQNQMKQQVQENIESHIFKIMSNVGLGENLKVKRREYLRKIKQNLRKRHKYKQKNNNNTATKIGGAEIILSNLISLQPQDEIQETLPLNRLISTGSVNQESQKKRRKKQETFNLLWNQQNFEQMKLINSTADRKQMKYENMNDLLTLHVIKDTKNEDFSKTFQKTIQHSKDFPKKIDQIEIQQPEKQKIYSQINYDKEYQQFMLKNQCQMDDLIKHFLQVSCYLFPQQLDLTSKNHILELEARKLFTAGSITNSKTKMIKYQKQIVTIMDQQFMKENQILKKIVGCCQIYFLIEYYLAKFGNKWDLITQCIRLNPITKSMLLNKAQIQNLHLYYNMKRQKNITFPDKLVLPYKSDFEINQNNKNKNIEQTQHFQIELQHYDRYLKQACTLDAQTTQQSSQYDKKFQNFKNITKNLGLPLQNNTFIEIVKKQYSSKINETLSQFKYYRQDKKYCQKKAQKFISPLQAKLLLPKNAKMNSTILKRRKNVSQKTSNLVNIFTRIRRPAGYPLPNPMAPMYPPAIKKTQSMTSSSINNTSAQIAVKLQPKPLNPQKKMQIVKEQNIGNIKTDLTVKVQTPIKKSEKGEKGEDKNKSGQKQKKQKKQKDKDKDKQGKDKQKRG